MNLIIYYYVGESHYCILIILYNYSYMIGHCNFIYLFLIGQLYSCWLYMDPKKWKSLNKFYSASIITTKDSGHGDEGV